MVTRETLFPRIMCGRTACYLKVEDLEARVKVPLVTSANEDKYRVSYNVPPSRFQAVIIQGHEIAVNQPPRIKQQLMRAEATRKCDALTDTDFPPDCVLTLMKWGVPLFGSHKPVITNARLESLLSSSAKHCFNRLKHHGRCIVLANGYFEWSATKGATGKQPYYICPKNIEAQLFYLAGLYHIPHDSNNLDDATYCLVTGEALAGRLAQIHDRMPLILKTREDIALWLDPDKSWSPLHDALLTVALEESRRAQETMSKRDDKKTVIQGPRRSKRLKAAAVTCKKEPNWCDANVHQARFMTYNDIQIFPVSSTMNTPAVDGPSVISPLSTNNFFSKKVK